LENVLPKKLGIFRRFGFSLKLSLFFNKRGHRKEINLSKRSTLLITGGAGYIGSHAVKESLNHGFEPITYDNLSVGRKSAVKAGTLVKGELSDRAKLVQTFKKYKPQAVMHFASHTYVGESVTNPQKYYRDNLTNAMNLFSVMLDRKVKYFILSSTCAVYGDPVEVPMPEDHPKNPVNPYGDSKLMLEKILAWYDKAYGLKSTFLRYFNAAGADASGEIGEVHDPETHLIPLVLDAAMGRRENITVFGTDYPTPDGTCIRDYIHVTDLAGAHFLALKRMMETGQSDTFNLGTGKGFSVKEVISKTEEVTGLKVPVEIGSRRAGDPPQLVAQAQKAGEVLKWAPQHSSLENILATAWKWHQNYFGKKTKKSKK
jgi:UDP-glucose 4-epimerase